MTDQNKAGNEENRKCDGQDIEVTFDETLNLRPENINQGTDEKKAG